MERGKKGQSNPAAFRAAFPATIPVMTGYLCLGMAFGVLMTSAGYGPGWSFFSSLFPIFKRFMRIFLHPFPCLITFGQMV